MATSDPITVGVVDASRLLSLSERKIWELVKAGEIPFLKVGSRTLFCVEALKKWAADRVERQSAK